MGSADMNRSIDGEFSIADFGLLGSSMNHKSSSTSFDYDLAVKEDEQTNIVNEVEVERKAIRCINVSVIIILMVFAVSAASIIVMNVKKQEEIDFDSAFSDGAWKIGDTFQRNIGIQLRSLETLAIHTTSWASGSNSTWPLVTVPDFDLRGQSARDLSDALSIMLLPIVLDNVRETYEQYTRTNQQWIPKAMERQVTSNDNNADSHERVLLRGLRQENTQSSSSSSSDNNDHKNANLFERQTSTTTSSSSSSSTITINDTIFQIQDGVAVSSTDSGPFFPIWTSSPVVPELINYDLGSYPSISDEVSNVVWTEKITFGKAHLIQEVSNSSDWFFKTIPSVAAKATKTDEGKGEPLSNLYFPVFESSYTEESKKLVGILSSTSVWSSVLTYALRPNEIGFVAVLGNDCGQKFTYQLDGEDIQFIGEGDHHDTTYNSHRYIYSFADVVEELQKNSILDSFLLEIDTEYCGYTLEVYPTKVLEESFSSNRAAVYAAAVIVVFLATMIVFGCYGIQMERRQEHVMKEKVEAQAIVASLFPIQVRDRLFAHRRTMAVRVKGFFGFGKKVASSSNGSVTEETSNERRGERQSTADDSTRRSRMDQRPSLRSQSTMRLKTYLDVSGHGGDIFSDDMSGRPIADLFPNTTVLFGDVCGFTSWCSQRDPEQVFILLETIYGAFDKIARRRGVFKVETIGDCYMAVTGLPDPQENHAWLMAKFALDCRSKMVDVLRDLEVSLGPDTSDLCMRFGMHSGPTTAGVLRGDKSRFQLFGDTVNTASRMESTGEENRIQLSQATANNLIELGKGDYLRPRNDMVQAKGKGLVKTFWLASRSREQQSLSDDELLSGGDKKKLLLSTGKQISTRMGLGNDLSDSEDSDIESENEDPAEKKSVTNDFEMSILFEANSDGDESRPDENLELEKETLKNRQKIIMWQSGMLARALRLIVARRDGGPSDVSNLKLHSNDGSIVLDEVAESITLQEFDAEAVDRFLDPDEIVLSRAVIAQLNDYVAMIASMYPANEFHNFEHATHVAMAASKLLSRMVVQEFFDSNEAYERHMTTDGINSDPLCQFAIIFSCMIHDVDHPGVPNDQLAKEEPEYAELYKKKSIAEQKSVDLAWDLLMDPKYLDLRACIYSNENDLNRFRQLVVNCVMATDLFETSMKEMRIKRWEDEFSDETPGSMSLEASNRRATSVIEHVMQLSDIAHTMQHWHVYRKWNEKLFRERLEAFKQDRSENDPAETWYEEELTFFDEYVIPLAKRLKDCEVFDIASNELLSYALSNRDEWMSRGHSVVEEMMKAYARENLLVDFSESASITFDELKD